MHETILSHFPDVKVFEEVLSTANRNADTYDDFHFIEKLEVRYQRYKEETCMSSNQASILRRIAGR